MWRSERYHHHRFGGAGRHHQQQYYSMGNEDPGRVHRLSGASMCAVDWFANQARNRRARPAPRWPPPEPKGCQHVAPAAVLDEVRGWIRKKDGAILEEEEEKVNFEIRPRILKKKARTKRACEPSEEPAFQEGSLRKKGIKKKRTSHDLIAGEDELPYSRGRRAVIACSMVSSNIVHIFDGASLSLFRLFDHQRFVRLATLRFEQLASEAKPTVVHFLREKHVVACGLANGAVLVFSFRIDLSYQGGRGYYFLKRSIPPPSPDCVVAALQLFPDNTCLLAILYERRTTGASLIRVADTSRASGKRSCPRRFSFSYGIYRLADNKDPDASLQVLMSCAMARERRRYESDTTVAQPKQRHCGRTPAPLLNVHTFERVMSLMWFRDRPGLLMAFTETTMRLFDCTVSEKFKLLKSARLSSPLRCPSACGRQRRHLFAAVQDERVVLYDRRCLRHPLLRVDFPQEALGLGAVSQLLWSPSRLLTLGVQFEGAPALLTVRVNKLADDDSCTQDKLKLVNEHLERTFVRRTKPSKKDLPQPANPSAWLRNAQLQRRRRAQERSWRSRRRHLLLKRLKMRVRKRKLKYPIARRRTFLAVKDMEEPPLEAVDEAKIDKKQRMHSRQRAMSTDRFFTERDQKNSRNSKLCRSKSMIQIHRDKSPVRPSDIFGLISMASSAAGNKAHAERVEAIWPSSSSEEDNDDELAAAYKRSSRSSAEAETASNKPAASRHHSTVAVEEAKAAEIKEHAATIKEQTAKIKDETTKIKDEKASQPPRPRPAATDHAMLAPCSDTDSGSDGSSDSRACRHRRASNEERNYDSDDSCLSNSSTSCNTLNDRMLEDEAAALEYSFHGIVGRPRESPGENDAASEEMRKRQRKQQRVSSLSPPPLVDDIERTKQAEGDREFLDPSLPRRRNFECSYFKFNVIKDRRLLEREVEQQPQQPQPSTSDAVTTCLHKVPILGAADFSFHPRTDGAAIVVGTPSNSAHEPNAAVVKFHANEGRSRKFARRKDMNDWIRDIVGEDVLLNIREMKQRGFVNFIGEDLRRGYYETGLPLYKQTLEKTDENEMFIEWFERMFEENNVPEEYRGDPERFYPDEIYSDTSDEEEHKRKKGDLFNSERDSRSKRELRLEREYARRRQRFLKRRRAAEAAGLDHTQLWPSRRGIQRASLLELLQRGDTKRPRHWPRLPTRVQYTPTTDSDLELREESNAPEEHAASDEPYDLLAEAAAIAREKREIQIIKAYRARGEIPPLSFEYDDDGNMIEPKGATEEEEKAVDVFKTRTLLKRMMDLDRRVGELERRRELLEDRDSNEECEDDFDDFVEDVIDLDEEMATASCDGSSFPREKESEEMPRAYNVLATLRQLAEQRRRAARPGKVGGWRKRVRQQAFASKRSLKALSTAQQLLEESYEQRRSSAHERRVISSWKRATKKHLNDVIAEPEAHLLLHEVARHRLRPQEWRDPHDIARFMEMYHEAAVYTIMNQNYDACNKQYREGVEERAKRLRLHEQDGDEAECEYELWIHHVSAPLPHEGKKRRGDRLSRGRRSRSTSSSDSSDTDDNNSSGESGWSTDAGSSTRQRENSRDDDGSEPTSVEPPWPLEQIACFEPPPIPCDYYGQQMVLPAVDFKGVATAPPKKKQKKPKTRKARRKVRQRRLAEQVEADRMAREQEAAVAIIVVLCNFASLSIRDTNEPETSKLSISTEEPCVAIEGRGCGSSMSGSDATTTASTTSTVVAAVAAMTSPDTPPASAPELGPMMAAAAEPSSSRAGGGGGGDYRASRQPPPVRRATSENIKKISFPRSIFRFPSLRKASSPQQTALLMTEAASSSSSTMSSISRSDPAADTRSLLSAPLTKKPGQILLEQLFERTKNPFALLLKPTAFAKYNTRYWLEREQSPGSSTETTPAPPERRRLLPGDDPRLPRRVATNDPVTRARIDAAMLRRVARAFPHAGALICIRRRKRARKLERRKARLASDQTKLALLPPLPEESASAAQSFESIRQFDFLSFIICIFARLSVMFAGDEIDGDQKSLANSKRTRAVSKDDTHTCNFDELRPPPRSTQSTPAVFSLDAPSARASAFEPPSAPPAPRRYHSGNARIEGRVSMDPALSPTLTRESPFAPASAALSPATSTADSAIRERPGRSGGSGDTFSPQSLLKLLPPNMIYNGVDYWGVPPEEIEEMMRKDIEAQRALDKDLSASQISLATSNVSPLPDGRDDRGSLHNDTATVVGVSPGSTIQLNLEGTSDQEDDAGDDASHVGGGHSDEQRLTRKEKRKLDMEARKEREAQYEEQMRKKAWNAYLEYLEARGSRASDVKQPVVFSERNECHSVPPHVLEDYLSWMAAYDGPPAEKVADKEDDDDDSSDSDEGSIIVVAGTSNGGGGGSVNHHNLANHYGCSDGAETMTSSSLNTDDDDTSSSPSMEETAAPGVLVDAFERPDMRRTPWPVRLSGTEAAQPPFQQTPPYDSITMRPSSGSFFATPTASKEAASSMRPKRVSFHDIRDISLVADRAAAIVSAVAATTSHLEREATPPEPYRLLRRHAATMSGSLHRLPSTDENEALPPPSLPSPRRTSVSSPLSSCVPSTSELNYSLTAIVEAEVLAAAAASISTAHASPAPSKKSFHQNGRASVEEEEEDEELLIELEAGEEDGDAFIFCAKGLPGLIHIANSEKQPKRVRVLDTRLLGVHNMFTSRQRTAILRSIGLPDWKTEEIGDLLRNMRRRGEHPLSVVCLAMMYARGTYAFHFTKRLTEDGWFIDAEKESSLRLETAFLFRCMQLFIYYRAFRESCTASERHAHRARFLVKCRMYKEGSERNDFTYACLSMLCRSIEKYDTEHYIDEIIASKGLPLRLRIAYATFASETAEDLTRRLLCLLRELPVLDIRRFIFTGVGRHPDSINAILEFVYHTRDVQFGTFLLICGGCFEDQPWVKPRKFYRRRLLRLQRLKASAIRYLVDIVRELESNHVNLREKKALYREMVTIETLLLTVLSSESLWEQLADNRRPPLTQLFPVALLYGNADLRRADEEAREVALHYAYALQSLRHFVDSARIVKHLGERDGVRPSDDEHQQNEMSIVCTFCDVPVRDAHEVARRQRKDKSKKEHEERETQRVQAEVRRRQGLPPLPSSSGRQPAAREAEQNGDELEKRPRAIACLACRKPLPRCAICRFHMHAPLSAERPEEYGVRVGFDFVVCTRCNHGGHPQHLEDWFRHNRFCAVAHCRCECDYDNVFCATEAYRPRAPFSVKAFRQQKKSRKLPKSRKLTVEQILKVSRRARQGSES